MPAFLDCSTSSFWASSAVTLLSGFSAASMTPWALSSCASLADMSAAMTMSLSVWGYGLAMVGLAAQEASSELGCWVGRGCAMARFARACQRSTDSSFNGAPRQPRALGSNGERRAGGTAVRMMIEAGRDMAMKVVSVARSKLGSRCTIVEVGRTTKS